MRGFGAVVAVGVLGVAVAASSSAATGPALTVLCGDVIDKTEFPYVGNSQPEHRYRPVLGVLAVPPAYMQQVVPTGEKPWAYWRKQGLVVRATGEAVTVTVPTAWRKRLAITWGNRAAAVSSLRINGCGTRANTHVGSAYAGGFLLRSARACVPLIFRVGNRSATVWFGIGQRCLR
jgi:hypothetical protein